MKNKRQRRRTKDEEQNMIRERISSCVSTTILFMISLTILLFYMGLIWILMVWPILPLSHIGLMPYEELLSDPSTDFNAFTWPHALMVLLYIILHYNLYFRIKNCGWKEKREKVITSGLFVLILLLTVSDIAIGIVWLSRMVEIDKLKVHLSRTIQDGSLKDVWDDVQSRESCCGVNGRLDYLSLNITVPESCRSYTRGCFDHLNGGAGRTYNYLYFGILPIPYVYSCIIPLIFYFYKAVHAILKRRKHLKTKNPRLPIAPPKYNHAQQKHPKVWLYIKNTKNNIAKRFRRSRSTDDDDVQKNVNLKIRSDDWKNTIKSRFAEKRSDSKVTKERTRIRSWWLEALKKRQRRRNSETGSEFECTVYSIGFNVKSVRKSKAYPTSTPVPAEVKGSYP